MARYKPEHKQESRARLVGTNARSFRVRGFDGAGVDDLAKDAGVTHGAFYGHFRSKSDAFAAAVASGMADLRAGVLDYRARHGDGWLERFVDDYLSYKRTCGLADACTLPALSGEIERQPAAVREAYERELRAVAEAIADGLDGASPEARMARAHVILALLAGGTTLARAVVDPALSEGIASSIKAAALQLLSAE